MKGNPLKKVDSSFLVVNERLEAWEKGGKGREGIEEESSEWIGNKQQARERHWFKRIIKHYMWIDASLQKCLKKMPKDKVRRILFLAAGEYLGNKDNWAKVVHFTVDQAERMRISRPERGMINAVLRRLPEVMAEIEGIEARYSHPSFLIERWKEQLGEPEIEALLQSNQEEVSVFLHTIDPKCSLEKGQFEDYYEITGAEGWEEARKLLESGRAYIQDPATRHPVELANLKGEERVLDLCSAPGGKSWQILQKLNDRGQLISVDLPGIRLEQLEANLNRGEIKPHLRILGAEIEKLNEVLPEKELFDVVLLDVPCSNTGVIRRKPEVKYRLSEKDFLFLAPLQDRLLEEAAKWVKPGGKMIYSTCSIDKEENEMRVTKFLASNEAFKLNDQKLSFPHIDHHDGGGAFLLTKCTSPNSTLN